MRHLHVLIIRTIPLLISLLSIVSCSNKASQQDSKTKSLETSLLNNNKMISLNNTLILQSMKDKSIDYVTKEFAGIWYEKAQQVQKRSDDLTNYLDYLKGRKELIRVLSDSLFQTIKRYWQDILVVDSSILNEFGNSLPLNSVITGNIDKENFYSQFFENSTPVMTTAILTKFQNDIQTTENKLLSYFHSKTTNHILNDSFLITLINQSSSVVAPGETITIKAAVGTYSFLPQEKILINNKQVNIEEGGSVNYSFNANSQPGNYKIPIRISFLNPILGKEEVFEKTIEYTVAPPCPK